MTLKEVIEQACRLTDSEKADYEGDLFYILADGAQKWIARNGKHIERMFTAKLTVCEECKEVKEVCNHPKVIDLPKDFYMLSARGIVSHNDIKKQVSFMLRHNLQNPNSGGAEQYSLLIDDVGELDIYYYANPADITKDVGDGYIFEVSPETHVAIPYYIAYNLVLSDDIALSTQLKNEWNRYMSVFTDVPLARSVKMKNAFGR